jgi:hypothetical protein
MSSHQKGLANLWMPLYASFRVMSNENSKPSVNYEALIAKAHASVRGIVDPAERGLAFNAILASLICSGEPRKQRMTYWSYRENPISIVMAALLMVFSLLSLWLRWSMWASFCAAVLIDVFIVYLMLVVGLYSDGRLNTYRLLPHRVPALLIGALLFAGLLFAFSNMYLHSGGICPGGTECPTRPDANAAKKAPSSQTFGSNTDAIYFSCVTMTTLGYGDYSAGTALSRELVVWQLLSGFALILLLVPLIVSRIANY